MVQVTNQLLNILMMMKRKATMVADNDNNNVQNRINGPLTGQLLRDLIEAVEAL
jgi:hypothetical protein